MRRFVAYLLAALVAASSVVTPARALAPVAVLAAPQVVTAAGSIALGIGVGILGAIAAYLEIQDAQGNASRVPLSDKPESVPPAPAAAPTVTPTSGYSWNVTSGCNAGASGTGLPTQQAAMDAYVASVNSLSACTGNGVYTYSSCSPTTMKWTTQSSSSSCYSPTGVSWGQDTTCSPGYTLSAGSCVLSNPREVTPDKKCDLALSNGAFGYASDMDCPGSGTSIDHSKAVPVIRGDGKTITIAGVDSLNRPVVIDVTRSADNTQTQVRQSVQTASNVQTTTTTVSNATRTITSVETQTAPGQITIPQTSPSTSTGSGTQADTPTVQTDPTKPPVVETCGLPGKPACVVDDTGFTGKDAFLTPKLSDIATAQDAMKTGVENSKDVLPTVDSSWLPSLMPGSAVACKPVPYQAKISHGPLSGFDHTENLDICPQLDIVRQILGYLMFVVTVWRVWRIFARSNQGE